MQCSHKIAFFHYDILSVTYCFLYVHTAISRKVVGKNVHATIPKENMGYDQYMVPDDCSCRTYFCCFPWALAKICLWPPMPFFQISLKNKAPKTTHNTFPDCHVHFFWQPFSKWLYTTFFQEIFTSDKSTSLRKAHNKSVCPHTAVRKSPKLIFSVSRAFFVVVVVLVVTQHLHYACVTSENHA